MKPLRDCILIKADAAEKKTASGLYINENWKTLPPFGKILAIGPDVTRVKVGERVMYNRYAATILEGDERIITEKDIMAIMQDKEADDGTVH